MPPLINMTDVLQGHSDLSRQRSSSTLTSHVILGKKKHPRASIEMLAYIKNLADTWCIFNLVPRGEMWLNPGIITNLLGLNGSRSKEYNFFVVQLLKFVVSTAQSGIMQLLCASWSHTLVTHKLPAHLPTPISAVCLPPTRNGCRRPGTARELLLFSWKWLKGSVLIESETNIQQAGCYDCSPFWRNSVAMEADGCGRDIKVTGS